MPKISAYPAGTPLLASDKFIIARGGQNYYILGSEFMPQSGGMRNGKISVTVAGGNITLALKTLAGANPSASDPVLVYVGGAWRAVTAALSVTRNAGTNWLNLGSAALATKEADLFARIGYNSIDGVTIGFNRDPSACIYSNFSTTTTNEKHCAISTITNAAAGDEYVIIGRFAATLSAGAAYTWSVPTYTAANLIQHPIYETRWLDWQPAYSASGSLTYTIVTTTVAKYMLSGPTLRHQVKVTGTLGGTAHTTIFMTVPFDAAQVAANISIGTSWFGNAYTGYSGIYASAGTPNLMAFEKVDASNFPNAGTLAISGSGAYQT